MLVLYFVPGCPTSINHIILPTLVFPTDVYLQRAICLFSSLLVSLFVSIHLLLLSLCCLAHPLFISFYLAILEPFVSPFTLSQEARSAISVLARHKKTGADYNSFPHNQMFQFFTSRVYSKDCNLKGEMVGRHINGWLALLSTTITK